MASTAKVLNAKDICVRFGGLSAIANVDLALPRHEVIGLVGPNGAGKTTFVNCLTGFQKPTSGAIQIDEYSTRGWRAPRFRREGVSRSFQGGRLFANMTVLENVEVVGVALGMGRGHARAAAADVLGRLGLSGKEAQMAGTLPYTDERRLSIARALIGDPAFVLLDEPAAGMADAECDELIELVNDLPETFGCGVLLIEHNMRMIMTVCSTIHVLDGGRKLAVGTPEEIRANRAVAAAYLGSDAQEG